MYCSPSAVGEALFDSNTSGDESTLTFLSWRYWWAQMGRVEGGRDDAVVLGQQVVRALVEVGDAPHAGGHGHDLVAVPR